LWVELRRHAGARAKPEIPASRRRGCWTPDPPFGRSRLTASELAASCFTGIQLTVGRLTIRF
jgi:hypothetical protein